MKGEKHSPFFVTFFSKTSFVQIEGLLNKRIINKQNQKNDV